MTLTPEQVQSFRDGVNLASIALAKLHAIKDHAKERLGEWEYTAYYQEAVVALETAGLRFKGE